MKEHGPAGDTPRQTARPRGEGPEPEGEGGDLGDPTGKREARLPGGGDARTRRAWGHARRPQRCPRGDLCGSRLRDEDFTWAVEATRQRSVRPTRSLSAAGSRRRPGSDLGSSADDSGSVKARSRCVRTDFWRGEPAAGTATSRDM